MSRRESSGNEIQSRPAPSVAKGSCHSIAHKKNVSNLGKGKEIQSQPPNYEQYISYIKSYCTQMTLDDAIKIQMDANILGWDHVVELRRDDLKEVADHEWASAAAVHCYMRYLFIIIIIIIIIIIGICIILIYLYIHFNCR